MSTLFLLLFVTTAVISLLAAWRVRSVYARYSRLPASSGVTGAEAAALILEQAGIHDVEIVKHNELLGDHYDPLHKRLVLSSHNYDGTSTAALGVAAHECGHAIQHQIAYGPLKWRMAAVGVTSFASQVVFWLPLLGMATGLLSGYVSLMLLAMAWGVIMLFNLVTLPVEFDASRRARITLSGMNFIGTPQEAVAVRKVLDAAAWTYVAALITSLLYFLWHLLPLLTGRDDD
ncbi:MAG: zinc metallopeptidase [Verrucomicrobia bacterium]|nr:zinc metallopeptidase [Verrucomicrobiota bacterium]